MLKICIYIERNTHIMGTPTIITVITVGVMIFGILVQRHYLQLVVTCPLGAEFPIHSYIYFH